MEQHFCVSVYVFNPENKKFLLVKHKKMGKWVQPGGHIEPNENQEEAAIREVFEETGLKVELIGKRVPREEDFILPLAIQRNIVKDNHIHIDFVYVAKVIDNNEIKQNIEETDGIDWFTLDQINDPSFETFDDIKEWCQTIINNY